MTEPPSQDEVRRAVERQFRTRTFNGHGSRLITEYPDAAAEVAMAVVGPVLEDRDAEIARLQGLVAAWMLTGEAKSGSEGKT